MTTIVAEAASPSRGEGGAPSLGRAFFCKPIRALSHERPSDGAPGGGDGGERISLTPARNAIGLSPPVAFAARDGMGGLSPWRSILPPQGGGK